MNRPHSGYGYVRCRTLGHAWFDVPSEWTSDYGDPLTLRCERCGMERRDAVSRATGELVTRRYTRPEGYGYTADDPRPTFNEFRLMLLDLREAEQNKKVARRRIRRAG